MNIILLIIQSAGKGCDNYSLDIDSECEGEDSRPAEGIFNMLWIWVIFTFINFVGTIISLIRDIVPSLPRGDNTDRYPSGESRNIFRFLLEEYLVTGWFISKAVKKFSNTARLNLIFLIIYSEMLLTGLCYSLDERDLDDLDEYDRIDLVYSIIANVLTFGFYFIGYGLLLETDYDEASFESYRKLFGYILVGIFTGTTMIFVFAYTYYMNDENDRDYEDLVSLWVEAFFFSLFFETLFSENIRVCVRMIILCRNNENSTGEVPQELQLVELREPGVGRKSIGFENY